MAINIDFGFKQVSENRDDKAALKRLRPIIQQWGKNIKLYCETVVDDAPYYYNERANLSLLAAAAWLEGVVSLEEYHTTKRGGRGRTDLFFNVGGEDGVQLEAKQHWMRAGMSDKALTKKIKRAVKMGRHAAQQNTEADARVACNFFVPFFSRDNFRSYKKEPDRYITEELVRFVVENKDEADAWAWCFPSSKQQRTFSNEEYGTTYYYPGVLLALNFASKFRWR